MVCRIFRLNMSAKLGGALYFPATILPFEVVGGQAGRLAGRLRHAKLAVSPWPMQRLCYRGRALRALK